MIQLDSIPSHAPNVVGRLVDDEAVLIITKQAKVKVTNETGAYIWSSINGIKTIRQIAESVSNYYFVDAFQAEEDTLEFIAELVTKGIVIIQDFPAK
jgi:hypothetical protein